MAHSAQETPVKNSSIVVEQIVILAISLFVSVVYGMNFSIPLK